MSHGVRLGYVWCGLSMCMCVYVYVCVCVMRLFCMAFSVSCVAAVLIDILRVVLEYVAA